MQISPQCISFNVQGLAIKPNPTNANLVTAALRAELASLGNVELNEFPKHARYTREELTKHCLSEINSWVTQKNQQVAKESAQLFLVSKNPTLYKVCGLKGEYVWKYLGVPL